LLKRKVITLEGIHRARQRAAEIHGTVPECIAVRVLQVYTTASNDYVLRKTDKKRKRKLILRTTADYRLQHMHAVIAHIHVVLYRAFTERKR